MRDLKDKVFPVLDNGCTVVMPTEESARAMAVEYVKCTGKAVLASKCLSFDRFASAFIPASADRKAADDMDRLLFAESFTERKAESLSYFYNPDYPDIKNSLPSFINRMLPALSEAFSKEMRSRDLFMDLSLIMAEYRSFLDSNGLYEEGWAEYEDRELEEDYYLYHPDAFPKELKLLERIGGNPRIHRITGTKEPSSLSVYRNEAQEIRVLFQRIRNLIDNDVSLSRIAISTSALTRIRPYLELEARLFSVPLYFVPGLKASCTPPGRFLKALGDVYSNDYEIDEMKKLFLDPSFPFKDRDGISGFIAKAVSLSVKNAPKGKSDRYSRLGFSFYRNFRKALDMLMSEKDASKVLFRYESLMNLLMGDERFINSEINDRVYGFIADAMSRFMAKACRLSLRPEKPLFPIFLDYIDNLSYVEREKAKGISVYPFSQAAATPYDYHFLITLNENESAETIREASFLSEYERESFEDTEITDALIASYQGVSGTVYYSASEDTYSGYALPLVALMDDNMKRINEIPLDPYQMETSEKRSDVIYPLQRKCFDAASISAMRKRGKSREVKGLPDEYPHLSFSKIHEYIRCPYSYALKYCYGLDKEQTYTISLMDNLEIGTRLHSALERFFSNGEEDPLRIEMYLSEEIDAWKDGKRFCKDGTMRDMEFGAASATDELASYVKAKFLDNLISVSSAILKETNAIKGGNEVRLSSDFEGYRLSGAADMIARSVSGEGLVIYDFKKGRAFKTAEIEEKKLQFCIYQMLIGLDERFSESSVLSGEFVTLADAKIKEAWKRDTDGSAEAEQQYADLIRSVASGIHDGRWPLHDNPDDCSSCGFRKLCRRKFVIQ